MKKSLKCFPVLMALSMMLTLAGCTVAAKPEPASAVTASQGSEQTAAPAESSTVHTSEEISSSDSTTSLVVYFSWSGNTQQMAQWIADESSSDLYRVAPKEAYGEDFDSCADRAKNELDNGIRPELADLMDDLTMAQYETIYAGFPIWWYDLPMAMTAFLEQYDLSGKTIIPFFSHNGSAAGAAAPDTLTEICPGATVLTNKTLSLSGSQVKDSETQIREWVGELKE